MVFFLATLITACAMEGWAATWHRLGHGLMWFMHASHHDTDEPAVGQWRFRWVRNDVANLLHAAIAAPLFVLGVSHVANNDLQAAAAGFAAGMTLYGILQTICHEGFVHRRLPVAWLGRSRYMRRVAAIHRLHHRTHQTPYGFFLAPWLIKVAAHRKRRQKMSHIAKETKRNNVSAHPASALSSCVSQPHRDDL